MSKPNRPLLPPNRPVPKPQRAWNSCRSLASLSPLIPLTTSGALTRRNGTPHSLAMACASAVLPQPGGPCSSTPRGGSTPSHA